jgi:hypothetical protein
MRTIRLLYKTRIIFYTSLLILFYNEFLIYWLSYTNWPQLTIKKENTIRLLLIADPQLIGDNDEPWYQDSIARWDSDRYLQNTYRIALSYTQPDVIIFLGDLFDEGLKSSDEQFQSYYQRFNKIFKINEILEKNTSKILYIPGDNDIGGEYHNDRSKKLEKRFESYFGSMIQLNHVKDLSFLHLDLDQSSSFYSKNKRDYVRSLIKDRSVETNYMIILNHMSIFKRYNDEVSRVS